MNEIEKYINIVEKYALVMRPDNVTQQNTSHINKLMNV